MNMDALKEFEDFVGVSYFREYEKLSAYGLLALAQQLSRIADAIEEQNVIMKEQLLP